MSIERKVQSQVRIFKSKHSVFEVPIGQEANPCAWRKNGNPISARYISINAFTLLISQRGTGKVDNYSAFSKHIKDYRDNSQGVVVYHLAGGIGYSKINSVEPPFSLS